jgi:hypothetical protein
MLHLWNTRCCVNTPAYSKDLLAGARGFLPFSFKGLYIKSLCSLHFFLCVIIIASGMRDHVSVIGFQQHVFGEVWSTVVGLQYKICVVASQDAGWACTPQSGWCVGHICQEGPKRRNTRTVRLCQWFIFIYQFLCGRWQTRKLYPCCGWNRRWVACLRI